MKNDSAKSREDKWLIGFKRFDKYFSIKSNIAMNYHYSEHAQFYGSLLTYLSLNIPKKQ